MVPTYGQTDKDGQYTIDALPAGDYKVEFSGCGSANVLYEFYDNSPDLESADAVTVTTGTPTPDIDAKLDTGASISGTVTDSGSNPASVCVFTFDSNGESAGNSPALTTARGLCAQRTGDR